MILAHGIGTRSDLPLPVRLAALGAGAAVVFGRRWFTRGDGFEVYSTLLGALSPLGRRTTDRAVVLRNPLHGMETVPSGHGLLGVVVVLIGTGSLVAPPGGNGRAPRPAGYRTAPRPGDFAHTLVPIAAIVLGHLVAAVAAHERAVRLLPTAAAVRTQYPLLAAMVALTMGAVGLVFAG